LAARYFVFLAGLFFMGLGASLVTKSKLGTPPISSVPYVLSMMFPFTFGQFTFLLSLFFVLVQMVILRKSFPKKRYVQVLVGLFFGFFIDFGMFVFTPVNPHLYAWKIFVLVLGSTLVALGTYLQVAPNVILNPGEGAVKTIAAKTGANFGTIKVIFDSTLLISAAIISLFAFGTIKGLREGTILSAVLVGCIVNGFSFLFRRIRLTHKWLEYLSGSPELVDKSALPGAEEMSEGAAD
jgi:uncharacterized membrane protein YczE